MKKLGSPSKSSFAKTARAHHGTTSVTGTSCGGLSGVHAAAATTPATVTANIGVTAARGRNHTVSSTGQRCPPGTVAAQPLEDAVWDDIAEALGNPQLLADEYQRRVEQERQPDTAASERKRLQADIKQVSVAQDRVTDAYIRQVMDLDRSETEMNKLCHTRDELERATRALDQRQQQVQDSQKALEHLDKFCSQASRGLDAL